jgi:Gpi18-like mannosyltransferase
MRLHYLVKVPPVLFDLLLAPLIFMATRRAARLLPEGLAAARRLPPVQALEDTLGLAAEDTLGLAAGWAFLLSPGVIYDSAVWAQTESIITFFMLGAILALAVGRVGPAWALWAIAFVIKPQPVVIVPALVALTFWRFGWWGLVRGALGATAGAFGMLGYFLATGNGPFIWGIYQELFQTYDQHISVNAWNLWWIGHVNGLRASDVLVSLGPFDLTVQGTSYLLLVLSTLAILSYLHVRRDLVGLLVACAMLEFAFYLFPISTHERYLYPLFAFLAPLLLLQPRWLILYVPLSAIFFLNIFFTSPSDPDIMGTYLESDFGLAMAGLNVAFFVVTAAALVVVAFRARPWPHPLRPTPAPPD